MRAEDRKRITVQATVQPPPSGIGCMIIALPLAILASPLLLVLGVWNHLRHRAFRRRFDAIHGTGRRGILIYSDSPNWQSYIESHWLPRLRGRLVVLNWSERARWDELHPLEAPFVRRHMGDINFNPIAIVFLSSRVVDRLREARRAARRLEPIGIVSPFLSHVSTVRFLMAFRDFKHGRDEALRAAEARLWSLLGDDPDTSSRSK